MSLEQGPSRPVVHSGASQDLGGMGQVAFVIFLSPRKPFVPKFLSDPQGTVRCSQRTLISGTPIFLSVVSASFLMV